MAIPPAAMCLVIAIIAVAAAAATVHVGVWLVVAIWIIEDVQFTTIEFLIVMTNRFVWQSDAVVVVVVAAVAMSMELSLEKSREHYIKVIAVAAAAVTVAVLCCGHVPLNMILFFLYLVLSNKTLTKQFLPKLLFNAVSNNNLVVVWIMTQRFFGMRIVDIDCANFFDETALHCACRRQAFEIVRCLLRNGADVRLTNCIKDTAAHIVTKEGNLELLRVLIEESAHGPDIVEAKDFYFGRTLLALACSRAPSDNSCAIAKYLVASAGADVGARDKNNNTALHHACFNGWFDTTHYLVTEAGANVNAKEIRNGDTPLHFACRKGHCDVVRLLIESGANVNAINHKSETPLHLACAFACLDTLRHLTNGGAIIQASTEVGSTALSVACDLNRLSIVRFLVEADECDVRQVNHDGRSALHAALDNCNSDGNGQDVTYRRDAFCIVSVLVDHMSYSRVE